MGFVRVQLINFRERKKRGILVKQPLELLSLFSFSLAS